MKANLKVGGREIIIENIKKVSPIGKFIGLMFTRREKAQALLFDFSENTEISIHSFFVFFDFIAIWLDDNGKVIEMQFITPWQPRIKPGKPFKMLLEVPINGKYKEIIKSLLKARR